MLILAWVINNWKVVGASILVLTIAGYIGFLSLKVSSLESAKAKQAAEIASVRGNLSVALGAIDNVNAAVRQYQKFVNASLASLKNVQGRIADENRRLGAMLDNLAIQATAARRIVDAPRVPFFVGDNLVVTGTNPVWVRIVRSDGR